MRYLSLAIGAAVLALTGCAGKLPSSQIPDSRSVALGIQCSASLSLTGALQPGASMPTDMTGCWGDGTWAFSAKVIQNGCTQSPQLAGQYQYNVAHDADNNPQFTFLNDQSDPNALMRIQAGGGGVCEGQLTLFSSDGKQVLNMKPTLEADGSLDGMGEYDVYDFSQLD